MTSPSPAVAATARKPWAPEHNGWLVGSGWLGLAEYLATHDISTAVTTGQDAGAWGRRVWAAHQQASVYGKPPLAHEERTGQIPPVYERVGTLVVAEGVAVQDLYALMPVTADSGIPSPSDTARFLLTAATRQFPVESVRNTVGWLLVAKDAKDGTGGRCREKAALRRDQWAGHGMGSTGWMYAAAGFTPAEAVSARAAGALTEDRVRMMAALRGASVPVG